MTYRSLLVALVVAACTRGDAAPAESGARRVPVALHEVTDAPFAPRIVASGVVGGKEEVTLSFKIGGIVARVSADEGASVKAGQVLAELSPVEIAGEATKAREARGKAGRDLARVRALYADSVATLEQLEDATTALEVAEQNVRIAEFNQRHAIITAPSDGIVLRRLAEPGQLAAPGAPIVVVRTARRGLVLRAGVADRDALRLAVGDEADVVFDALPGRRLSARVTQIGADASPVTGTYDVELSLGADAARLASGLVGRATIVTGASGRYPIVPIEALLEAEGDSATLYVVPIEGDLARRRRVAIAQLDGDVAVVSGGVKVGERVVVRGAAYVDDGAPVSITTNDGARRVP